MSKRKRTSKVITALNRNYVVNVGGKVSDITIERLSAAIAVIETIATNNSKVLAALGVTVEDVLTVCQYARKAWFDMNGGKRK